MGGKDLAARKRGESPAPAPLGSAMVNREGPMRGLTKLLRCERGVNAIEYALVASLISIAALAAYQQLGNKVDTMYNNVSNHLN
jgi:pilus assembly protein Flp/PilA